MDAPLLEVLGCRQAYHKEANADLVVLDDVNLTLREGEIVALLGRSGSGKSTLLRIVSGLLRPTAGQVTWRGTPIAGPTDGVAMVFQSFALFPWLTVQENVELGLRHGGRPRGARKARGRRIGSDWSRWFCFSLSERTFGRDATTRWPRPCFGRLS